MREILESSVQEGLSSVEYNLAATALALPSSRLEALSVELMKDMVERLEAAVPLLPPACRKLYLEQYRTELIDAVKNSREDNFVPSLESFRQKLQEQRSSPLSIAELMSLESSLYSFELFKVALTGLKAGAQVKASAHAD